VPNWALELFGDRTPFDVIVVALSLVAAGRASLSLYEDGSVLGGTIAVLGGITVVYVALRRFKILVATVRRADQVKAVTSVLESLRFTLENAYKRDREDGSDLPNPRLRLTVLVPKGTDSLEQVLDYVGDNRSGQTAGRLVPRSAGIVGKALENGELFAATRRAAEERAYIEELTKQWNFSAEQARNLDRHSQSWLAAPIVGPEGTIAVLFVDAVVPDFFDEPAVETIEEALPSIALFFGMNYASNNWMRP
jgi:hypothetical protein